VDFWTALTGLRPLQEATIGNPKVCVAVLDGPVDLSHACFSGANIRRVNTLVHDSAGNGPMSLHGTHVASLIFGQPNSSVPGIAPRCLGLIAPIFRDDREHLLSQLDLARAIEQCVEEGAQVINISGGEKAPGEAAEPVLQRALQLCEDSGVLVVAAVGNDGCSCLHVPAAIPSVLGVGALGTDGEPLETSNWGEAYKSNAILAPGEKIPGAAPGGETAVLNGSSFATPIVSGIAALLLSTQIQNGRPPDPLAVRRALLDTALPCQPRDSPACDRYLAGELNIPGAYASITKGAKTVMASMDTIEAQRAAADGAENEVGEPGSSAASISHHEAVSLQPSGSNDEVAMTASGDSPATPESPQMDASAAMPSDVASTAPVPRHASHTDGPPAPRPGVVSSSAGCGCQDASSSYVFAIGTIGFDFGTEARRDTFRQLMQSPLAGEPPVSVPPNPYDVIQLSSYLADYPSESTKLIWTLNLDATPIYAIEAESAYAEEVYGVFRSAMRNQVRPKTDQNYVSRVSIPGVLTAKTRRLFSGQIVPLVIAQARGLSTWNESALLESVADAVLPEVEAKPADTRPSLSRDDLLFYVRNFLDKIYYELRNLGQSPSDRALNYAATNAFTFANGVILQQAMLSPWELPGGGIRNIYTLDTISVAKSPYCRPDSICYDVQVRFFDPESDRRARSVYQYTIDVSDEMPVSLAPTHQFFVAM
jgi:cyanobactin maturation PatA/PatG family protease